MLGSVMWDVLRVHVLQFTLVLVLLSLLSWWTSKRWPQVSFMLLILALLKCLVPPVIPNPLGVFSWHPQLALQAENLSTNRLQLLQAENERQRQSQLWRTWLQTHALQPELAGPAPRLARSGWLKVTGQVLLAVWGTGTLLLLLGTLRQFCKLNLQIQRTSRTPPAWLVRRVHELKASLGIRKHVNIRVSEANLGPGCIGLIKPTLVIPKSMVDLMPERCWQPILAHELIHLRRRDVLWGYLQYAVQILWWFHPLVWWLGKRLSLTCERCVDQQVLSSLPCTPTAYGESLVRVLQLKRVMRPLPTAQHLSAAEVTSHRLRSLRNYPQRTSRWSALAAWCLFLAGTCAILPGTSIDATPTDSVADRDLRESREAILACVNAQDWKSAEKLLQTIVSTTGSTSEAHILLGHVFMQQQKFQAAESQFLEACTQAATMPFALYQCCRAAASRGDHELAMSYIRRALDVGFPLPQDSAADPALASLRRHAEFRSLEPEENRRKSIAATSRGKHPAGKHALTMLHGLSYTVPESLKAEFVGLEAAAELLPIRDWSQQDRFADYLWESHFWLDSWGRILETQATFADSKAQILATRLDSNGNQWVERASTWHAADGGIQHWLEQSTDAGRSWNLMAQRFITDADADSHSYRTQGLLSPDEAPHHNGSNPMDTLQPPSKQPGSGQRRQQLRRSS